MTQFTTDQQYNRIVGICREIFRKKSQDYGTSWRVYRTISVADQIYIKAKRIRNIQEAGKQKIADDMADEFKGIYNYALIGLIQTELPNEEMDELEVDTALKYYDAQSERVKQLMEAKNHDYGEAWREMSQESFVDLILAKILRIRQILQNDGRTLVSEGIESNFSDIANYAVFALILMAHPDE
ncbi:MAG: DUF1599 domain-containing protein [Bacteroidota bacterium]|nr:DUF1599 domain-containing protein [Bacteroidota bacterium]